MYKHLRYNLTDSIAYMDKCLHILVKENKEVYISGDFNTNLLRLENNTSHQEFYNLMISFGFLPQILDPTRVTESSVTIIDNIYTNCHEYNHYSGNILISISDHFSQFVSVEHQKIDFKNITMYHRDYLNFNT